MSAVTTSTAVSIVIPTFNRAAALDRTLEHVVAVEHDDLEVIVVDDGSREDPTDVVARHAATRSGVRLVRQENRGAAAARNRGAAEATGDLLIFLDDDMLVDPDHVRRHLDVQARYGPCLTNGEWEFADEVLEELTASPFGRYRVELERWMTGISLVEPIDDEVGAPPGLTAANLAVPRDVFVALGGFDETFPHAGYEDQDLAVRARAAGHRFIHAGAIRLRHNDQRLTLDGFVNRQRQGAKTAVYLAAKDPAWSRTRPFLAEHLPPRRGDSAARRSKRWLRTVLASPPAVAGIRAVIAATERIWPRSPFLPRLYWLLIGAYMTRGVREGLRSVPGAEDRIRAAAAAGPGRPCPACGSTDHRPRGTAQGYGWRSCRRCGTASTDRVPDGSELAAYYADYYEPDTAEAAAHVRRRLDEVVTGWAGHRRTGAVLDVGYGAGDLLRAASRQGWTCWGTELADASVAAGRAAGWTVLQDDLIAAPLPAGGFDVVAMVEIVEHLLTPGDHLRRAGELLAPGGLLWGTTPNGGSLNHRRLGAGWSNVAPPEHLQLLSAAGLRTLLTEAGFESITIRSRGLNPTQLLQRRRPRTSSTDDGPVRPPTSSQALNAQLERSAPRRLVKRALNAVLAVTGVGDTLEFRAQRRGP